MILTSTCPPSFECEFGLGVVCFSLQIVHRTNFDAYSAYPKRRHGSAAYKALFFALVSSGIYILCYYYGGVIEGDDIEGLKRYELLDHPYPVAVIVTAFMAVLSAKVTFCYNRVSWGWILLLWIFHAALCCLSSRYYSFCACCNADVQYFAIAF